MVNYIKYSTVLRFHKKQLYLGDQTFVFLLPVEYIYTEIFK